VGWLLQLSLVWLSAVWIVPHLAVLLRSGSFMCDICDMCGRWCVISRAGESCREVQKGSTSIQRIAQPNKNRMLKAEGQKQEDQRGDAQSKTQHSVCVTFACDFAVYCESYNLLLHTMNNAQTNNDMLKLTLS